MNIYIFKIYKSKKKIEEQNGKVVSYVAIERKKVSTRDYSGVV